VNAVGGFLRETALQWAVRQGALEVLYVALLVIPYQLFSFIIYAGTEITAHSFINTFKATVVLVQHGADPHIQGSEVSFKKLVNYDGENYENV
jgi:hypothetical protein